MHFVKLLLPWHYLIIILLSPHVEQSPNKFVPHEKFFSEKRPPSQYFRVGGTIEGSPKIRLKARGTSWHAVTSALTSSNFYQGTGPKGVRFL